MKSKYRTLCLEKAMVERNLVHIANEKHVEAAKVLREREIRQKCQAKVSTLVMVILVMKEDDFGKMDLKSFKDHLVWFLSVGDDLTVRSCRRDLCRLSTIDVIIIYLFVMLFVY